MSLVKESVWDYPRPPRLEKTPRHLKVELHGKIIAETRNAYRVLETSHPPTYYLPPSDVQAGYLSKAKGASSFCEWKGNATYWNVTVPGHSPVNQRIWSYENPTPSFSSIKGYLSFYASPFECSVDGECVKPQEGSFYAGWITDDVMGPFKGAPNTLGW
ncbi:hypothetical protein ACKKBG_A17345 [Auxenochlorella protothecoides x Auxenochlorella symbiontica]